MHYKMKMDFSTTLICAALFKKMAEIWRKQETHKVHAYIHINTTIKTIIIVLMTTNSRRGVNKVQI